MVLTAGDRFSRLRRLLRRNTIRAAIVWTAVAVGVGVVARLTFAAPVPSTCEGDTSGLCFDINLRPLWYFLIGLLWVVGLVVIWLVPWCYGLWQRRSRQGSKRPAAKGPG